MRCMALAIADRDETRAAWNDFDLRTIRVAAASDVVRELREHARREDVLLYRWAEQNLETSVRYAIARGLRVRV